VQVEASFPAGGESFELVEQGEGLLDDVAEFAQAVDVGVAASGDDGQDASFAQFTAVRLAVVALVAEQGVGPFAGVADAAGDGRDGVDQGEGLGDIVGVRRRGDDLERGAVAVADQVVLAAALAAVDRRRARRGAPFFARTWEASTPARLQSSSPAAFNSDSSIRCSWSKTPACCQRSSLRQQVCPEPKPSSNGICCHGIPV
jgi:predicted alpha-1,6-mannanase (GH76 family)